MTRRMASFKSSVRAFWDMLRKVLCFSLVCMFYCPTLWGIMGEHDSREYVKQDEWQKFPYNNIVQLRIYSDQQYAVCTGQYVGSDLILTAHHCVQHLINQDVLDTDIITATGKYLRVRTTTVKKGNWDYDKFDEPAVAAQDWLLLRIPAGSPAIKSDSYFDVSNTASVGLTGENWGFGSMRVIRDDELVNIKQIVIDETRKVCNKDYDSFVKGKETLRSQQTADANYITTCLVGALDNINDRLGDKPLTSEEEGDKLKRSRCRVKSIKNNLLDTDCDTFSGNSGGPFFVNNNLYGVLSKGSNGFKGGTGADFAGVDSWRNGVREFAGVPPIIEANPLPVESPVSKVEPTVETKTDPSIDVHADSNVNNSATQPESTPTTQEPQAQEQPQEDTASSQASAQEQQSVVTTDVEPAQGEQKQGTETVIAENPDTQTNVTEQVNVDPAPGNSATQPESTPTTQEPQAQEQSQPVVVSQQVPTQGGVDSGVIEKEMETTGAELVGQIDDLEDMNPEQFLGFLDGMVGYAKLEQDYKKAKEREQSMENKLLGAAAIGLTGAGLSKTLAAAAEQKADEAAELDMAAYLATMHCNYAPGKNVKGGEKEVELPGANSLMPLYTEYVALANDLKVRKAALGMQPGIESEAILDGATSGLYDDVALGKTGGAYASLARALSDPNSEDAKKWAAQKGETSKDKKTGTALTATGAIGGAVGNLLINKDKSEEDK